MSYDDALHNCSRCGHLSVAGEKGCDCVDVHDGPPRNPKLPAGSGLVGTKHLVETLTRAEIEKLLSDALTRDGNDSEWWYMASHDSRGRGRFSPYGAENWELPNVAKGGPRIWAPRDYWLGQFGSGHLALFTPHRQVAPEIAAVQEEPLPSVQPLSRRDLIATQIYIAKMTNGVSYKIRFEDAVEEADLLIAQLDKEVQS